MKVFVALVVESPARLVCFGSSSPPGISTNVSSMMNLSSHDMQTKYSIVMTPAPDRRLGLLV